MKAWLLDELTGINRLRLADAPDPTPGDAEVLLQVELAALNPADRYLAENQYPAKPSLPHILGRDGVGIIKAVGKSVRDFSVGQRALILRGETGVNRRGTFAQLVVVAADSLTPVPAGWELAQAAAAPLVYLTAHRALTNWGDLPAKSVVLITGASGGVGVAATQLATAMNLRVVALSRSESKRKTLRDLGAEIALDPADAAWVEIVRNRLAPEKVKLAIDNIGGELLNEVLQTLGAAGRISLVGRLAGPVPSFNTAALFFREIQIGGVAVGNFTRETVQLAWKQIVQQLDRAQQRPVIDHVFPFADLPAAFKRLHEGPMGKVLLDVRTAK